MEDVALEAEEEEEADADVSSGQRFSTLSLGHLQRPLQLQKQLKRLHFLLMTKSRSGGYSRPSTRHGVQAILRPGLGESKEPRLAAETEDPRVVLTGRCTVSEAMVCWAWRRDVVEDTEEKVAAEVRLDPEATPLLRALPLDGRPRSSSSSQMFLATVWLHDQRPLQSQRQAYWEQPRVRRKEELPG